MYSPYYARKAISPIVAEVIIVAVAIAISIAVAGWLMGVWSTSTSRELYFPAHLMLNYPSDEPYYPVPGYFKLEAYSTSTTGNQYQVCVKVTALKPLERVDITATIKANDGQPPDYVGAQYAEITWTDTNLDTGWYTMRCWSPVQQDEYPITIQLHIYAWEAK